MTRKQHTGQSASKFSSIMLIASLAAVSVAVGVAYSMGAFGEKVTEQPKPLEITLSSERLDFGDVALHAAATRQLIVRNDGEKPLTAEILVDDANYRVSPEQVILHPGVGTRLRVELVGSVAGEHQNELRIFVGKGGSEPLVVALAGRVQESASIAASTARDRKPVAATSARKTSADSGRIPMAPSQLDLAPEGHGEDPTAMTVTVANASVTRQAKGQPGAQATTPKDAVNVDTSSRKPASGASSDKRKQGEQEQGSQSTARRGAGYRITTYDPATSAPIRSIAERPTPFSDKITAADAQAASQIPSKLPGSSGDGLPETLPEEPESDREKDLFDREEDSNDPFETPTLTISGQSTVRVMGSLATFYPQEIAVLGTNAGGFLSLTHQVDFPTVPLAFGESMLFAQTVPGGNGGFDPMTGQVTLELPLQAVDADGDAAPLNLILTTGTAIERNESGNVVAITGSPRVPQTGILRLVGIAKIPVGFRNGAEEHLAVFEILASLSFGNSIALSDTVPSGRIGG